MIHEHILELASIEDTTPDEIRAHHYEDEEQDIFGSGRPVTGEAAVILKHNPAAPIVFHPLTLYLVCHDRTTRGSLRKRITLTIITGISIILLTFGIASYYIIQKNIENSQNEKLAFARLIRNNIDNIIKDNINRLYDISISGKIDLRDNDFGPERDAIRTAYRYSIFTDGVFLLDTGGNIILNYPAKIRDAAINVLSIEPISRIIANNRPMVSNIYTLEPSGRKVMFVLVPLKDKQGNIAGVAGGEIDPTNPALTRMLGLTHMGKNMFIDIVDSNGVVISSSDPTRILTQCNRDKFFTSDYQRETGTRNDLPSLSYFRKHE